LEFKKYYLEEDFVKLFKGNKPKFKVEDGLIGRIFKRKNKNISIEEEAKEIKLALEIDLDDPN